MLIAQISDPHVMLPGASPGAGVDPVRNLERAIAAINALDPRPAALVVSGDLVELGSDAEYARLAAALATAQMPCHVMTGNHDDRAALLRAFPALDEHARGDGLQYGVDLSGLRLVLLDSLVEGTPAGRLGDARLAWLDERLRAAPACPTMVFVHHPPIATGLAHIDRSALLDGDRFAQVIAANPQVVRVACGHIHRALFRSFAGTTLSVCPSTAHQFVLDLRETGRITAVAEPPAWQLHRWHDGALATYTVPMA